MKAAMILFIAALTSVPAIEEPALGQSREMVSRSTMRINPPARGPSGLAARAPQLGWDKYCCSIDTDQCWESAPWKRCPTVLTTTWCDDDNNCVDDLDPND
jgi:hypothetical protein